MRRTALLGLLVILVAGSACGADAKERTGAVVRTETAAGTAMAEQEPAPGATIEPQPGQPSLGEHANALGPPTTDAAAIELYRAIDRVYRARERFLRNGRGCFLVDDPPGEPNPQDGVSNPCYVRLSDDASHVIVARDAALDLAAKADTPTDCGFATFNMQYTIPSLYDTIQPYVAWAATPGRGGRQAHEEDVRDAEEAYNDGLATFRSSCGEHP